LGSWELTSYDSIIRPTSIMGAILNAARPIGNPQPGRLTILVVEDEILLRMIVTDELRKQDFNVAEAANADEALSIIHSGIPIHLVLTDVKMSGTQDDLSFAGTIRADYPDVKVVVASGHLVENELVEDVDGFFRKPYDVSNLVRFIKALLD